MKIRKKLNKKTKFVLSSVVGVSVLAASCVFGVVSCTSNTSGSNNSSSSSSSDSNSSSNSSSKQSANEQSIWAGVVGSSNLIQLNTNYNFSQLMSMLSNWSNWDSYYINGNYVPSASAQKLWGSSPSTLQLALYGLMSNYTTGVFNATDNPYTYSNNQIVGMFYLLNQWVTDLADSPENTLSQDANVTVSISSWNNMYSYVNPSSNSEDSLNMDAYSLFEIFGVNSSYVNLSTSSLSPNYISGINLQSLLSMFSAWLNPSTASYYLDSYLPYINTQNVNQGTTNLDNNVDVAGAVFSPSAIANYSSSTLGGQIPYNNSWTPYNRNGNTITSSEANYSYLNSNNLNYNPYIFGESNNAFQTPIYCPNDGHSTFLNYPSLSAFLFSNLASNNTIVQTNSEPTLNTFGNYTIPTNGNGIQNSFLLNWGNSGYISNANSLFLSLLNDYSSQLNTVGKYGSYAMYLGLNFLNTGSNDTFSNSAINNNGYVANSDLTNLYPSIALLGLTNQNYLQIQFAPDASRTQVPGSMNSLIGSITNTKPLSSWTQYINYLYGVYFANIWGNYGGLTNFANGITNIANISSTDLSIDVNAFANSLQTLLQTYYNHYSKFTSDSSVPFAVIRFFNNAAYNSTQYYPITLYINKTSQLTTYPDGLTKSEFQADVSGGYGYWYNNTYSNALPVVSGTPDLSNFYYVTYNVGNVELSNTLSNNIPNSTYNISASNISKKYVLKVYDVSSIEKTILKDSSISSNPFLNNKNTINIISKL